MRIISILLLSLVLCVVFYAQSTEQSNQNSCSVCDADGCIRPTAESQTYGFFKNKVIKVLSANKLVLDNNYTVELVGIDNKVNQSQIKEFLNKNILNKEVWITASLRKKSDKKFRGAVEPLNDENIDSINKYLLENGLAKYKDFETDYLVPSYLPCRLKKAEQRAKEAKLGIWAK
jgi:hypothetical protein